MPVVMFSPQMDSWLGILPQWKRTKRFMFKKIEENYLAQPYQTSENILPVESMMIPLPLNNDMNHMNLQSIRFIFQKNIYIVIAKLLLTYLTIYNCCLLHFAYF